ncbi:uncharacterized protein LOC144213453 isoform X2 [Stigmatopora nigra]
MSARTPRSKLQQELFGVKLEHSTHAQSTVSNITHEEVVLRGLEDIEVRSSKARGLHLIELPVLSEEGIETTLERKKAEYLNLAAEGQKIAWKCTIYPVEVSEMTLVLMGRSLLTLKRKLSSPKSKRRSQSSLNNKWEVSNF